MFKGCDALHYLAPGVWLLLYIFGCGGGNSRAGHNDSNPIRLCDPSQNGLFSECPHRHNPIVVRPPKLSDTLGILNRELAFKADRTVVVNRKFAGMFYPMLPDRYLKSRRYTRKRELARLVASD